MIRTDTIIKLIAVLVAIIVMYAPDCCVLARKSSSLSAKKSSLGKIQHDMKEIKYKIKIANNEKNTVLGQLYSTEKELGDAQASLSQNKIRLFDAQNDLNKTNQRLTRTRKQLSRRRELLERRVVGIYEGDNLGFMNVVLGATDMWTFLTRTYYLQRILDSDTSLISRIKKDEESISKDKEHQEKRVTEIQEIQVGLVSERNRIARLADIKRDRLNQIENNKGLYEKALDALERKSNEIENQIQRMQSGPGTYRGKYNGVFKGGLIAPVSGKITSSFGYRRHPITGVYKLHTGVDFSVRSGTSVKAAGDGAVMMAGWMGPYGYTVVIDHGNSVSTLYGHNSRLLVSVGQTVKKGQAIAKSGSTGYSTGPHCHFEKRINGKPVNPL